MKNTYGIIGTGTASKKAIHAALNDLGTDAKYIIPWYGNPTEGLEHVYDWMLDNDATFDVIASTGKLPGVLKQQSEDYAVGIPDVDLDIISRLKPNGMTLVMWDENRESYMVKLSTASIDEGLPTLELTNGLVPVVFDDAPVSEEQSEPDDQPVNNEPVEDATHPEAQSEQYSAEELEVMPAAAVKRMARGLGIDVKTKPEAIAAITGKIMKTEVDKTSMPKTITAITVHYSDGTVTTIS